MDQVPKSARSAATILSIFFASGATSLVYQVLWTRWIGLIFGNTTISISIVLGAFMFGLALGSAIVGRRVAGIVRPLRAYAICEAGIGIFAIACPWLMQAVDVLYSAVDDGTSNSWLLAAMKVALSFALLCLPTGLMGATLPLLAEFFRRNPGSASAWRVGVLYAANTVGAAFGILLSGFVLIELLGITAVTGLAAMSNMLVAAVAWRMDREAGASKEEGLPEHQRSTSTSPVSTDLIWVSAALAVTGALALASEVIWTRVLSSFLGTSTYAFSTIVCTYLVGIAAGSALMSRAIVRIVDVRAAFLLVVLAAGVLHTASIELFLWLATSADLARGVPITVPSILAFYLEFALLLLPLALASGACFPLATKILNPNEQDAEGGLVAGAYAANTWGSVAGSLIAGFGIAAFLDFEPSLRVVAVGYVAAVVVGAVVLRRRSPKAMRIGALALLLCVAVIARAATRPTFAESVAETSFHRVLVHQPSINGITSVIALDGRPTPGLYVNHHGMTVKVTDTKMMAHAPMFLHPNPADVLVVCFGMGTTYRAALSHGAQATVVELVPGVADSFEYFHSDAAAIRQSPKGRILVGDGRHFLKATRERFDIITIDPPPPIDGEGVNHLYSRDFAELAKSRLKPGGFVAHWIPFPGTMSGVDDEESFRMLMDTFASAFPHVTVLRGFNNIGVHMIGSMEPVAFNEEAIAARFQARPEAVADLNEYDKIPMSFFLAGQPFRATADSPLIVTDDHPVLEFYLLRSLIRGQQKVLHGHLWSG